MAMTHFNGGDDDDFVGHPAAVMMIIEGINDPPPYDGRSFDSRIHQSGAPKIEKLKLSKINIFFAIFSRSMLIDGRSSYKINP